MRKRLYPEHFETDPVDCARRLIGCHFHWMGCTGRIVEMEAYCSEGDEACHTWFRPSARAFVENHCPGDAYVYLNYGVHWLFNILVKGGGQREGLILIRALEPVDGIDLMQQRRGAMPPQRVASGPGKLTKALGIDGSAHGLGFLTRDDCGIFQGEEVETIAGPRIGITRSVDLPWRFGAKGSPFLSRKF